MNSIPKGLLRTARWIRGIKSQEVRKYVYQVWLHDVYPELSRKYVEKYCKTWEVE